MPLYDYKCDCGKEFEVQQSITAEKYKDCSEVGYFDCDKPNKLKRLIGKPAIFSDDIGRGHKRMKDKDLYKELDIE
jgi:putative FmdB family regulatory protein|tara:strand:+ start:2410 stop:2637 length:228 start_codon:yes stop_codon:yes gene_type:complete